jgi:hypothetical protein
MPSGKRLKANRKYKSSVFASYFSETNQRLIDLYNAFSKVEYPADTPLEVNTLDSALFSGLINDISFVLDNMLIILIEHQSTWNPNMPYRLLLYIAEILQRRYNDSKPFYKPTLQQIEKIRCFVLYNGTEDRPEKSILRLSDAYKEVTDDIGDPELDIQLELVVPVYNISLSKNPEILARSKPLHEYSQFTAKIVEEQASGKDLTQAIKAAIKYCREYNIMADYLKTHETEVYNVLFQEMTALDYAKVQYEAGIEAGQMQGLEQGLELAAINAINAGCNDMTISIIGNMTAEQVKTLRRKIALE